mgnify:CR=1 FL=1
MGMLRSLFGEIRWTPPAWLHRIGRRRFFAGIGIAVLLGVVVFAAWRYYESLPKPARIVASALAPGVTPIVDDELKPQLLTVKFSVKADPRTPVLTTDSVARIDLVGKTVEEGVRLDPEMSGEWRWDNETELRFYPAADWPAGQEYRVYYEPSLFAENLELEDTSTSFETADFRTDLEELIFYQDPVERATRKVVATMSFTHPVDEESLKAHLSYSMREPGATIDTSARRVSYEITYDEHRRKAFVHSEVLEIPPQETYLTMHLTEGLEPANGPARFDEELVQNVRIPDIGSYFRVSSVQSLIVRNEEDEPEQTVTLEFTDRVNTDALQQKLTAYLLPTTVVINGRTRNNKRWSTPREVTPDILSQAEQIDFDLNPAEDDIAQFHSLRIDVAESRDVYLKIEQGLRSEGDFVMSLPYDTVVRSASYPKEATIAQSGALLPLTGEHRLTFVSRGVETLKVEVGRLIDSEVNHLASQTGGDIKSPYFNSYSFDEDNLTARTTRFIDLNVEHPKTAVYSNLDLSEFLPDGGYYFVDVQGWDRERDRAIGTRDRRFILITDLGLLVKSNADSSQDVFVHSLATGQPVTGARIELLGKNGIAIIDRTTGSDGHVAIPVVKDFERVKTPTVFVVRSGRDSIFMPFARGGRMLQYSRFDVGGEQIRRRTDADRLKAQLFTDRGLYRPGDTARLATIVKRDDWAPLGNLPLALNVRDPRGQNVMDTLLELPDDGFFEESFSTEAASPTGNYSVTLYLIEEHNRRRAIGSASFKVEEFQPDRLRIRSRISGQKPLGWLKPGDLSCEVELENLFGTPAESRRVTGQLELQPTSIRFSKYPGYVFDDPLRDRGNIVKTVTKDLAPTTTDQDGAARLSLGLGQYDKGIYRLSVFTEGFEEGGGRSVKAQASALLSPLDFLVGYRTDADLDFLKKDSEHSVHFLGVDSDANAMALTDLSISIVEERFVSTLVKRPNGTYAYQSILKEEPVSSEAYSLPEDGGRFVLPTGQPGRFAVKIADSGGLVFSKVRYTVAGARNLAGNLERNAELDLMLDGDSFDTGEEIRMEITAPYTGTGLITIERDRVYAYKWFNSDTTTSVQTIRVPRELEGNAYVNVAFVRDLDSPEVFVSPLSYAVAPFSISRAARTVEIDMKVPDLVRPGDRLDISYTANRSSRVVIYAVDEGILQVAKYDMPDPLGFFLRKMALQVGTYQMVDLILPDFDAYVRQAAPGGGEGRALAGRNLNPFRRKTEAPIAFWSGIVDAGPEERTVTFEVPDYFNGQLRVMAVAVSDAAVGGARDEALVRGPFVITPNVLTAVAPGDEFDVTVGLSNNLEGSGESAAIALSATPSEHLEIIGENKAELRIDEGREGRTKFRVRARDQLGSASLMFEASSGDEAARRSATLSVRPSVAYVATVAAGTDDADPISLDFSRTLYDEFAEQSAAASASPLVLADGLLDYLAAFPHGCAEQTVSKVFPQIGFLGNRDYEVDEGNIRKAFDKTVFKLRSRQTSEGWFRFWVTSQEPVDFASVYIMHFFTDAHDLGLSVPRDMLKSGLGYLQQLAAYEVSTLEEARLRAYAIYVLTRNGTVTTNYLTNLHEYLDDDHTDDWRADLTAAYMAASYEILKQATLGARLIGGYEMGAGDEMVSDFDTRLGRDAQYVYLLARHFPDRLDDVDAAAIHDLVAPVMQNRFNTLSSAYTILALGAYTKATFNRSEAARLEIADEAGRALAEAAVFARAQLDNSVDSLAISGSDGSDVYYVLSQTGFDRTPPQDVLASGLEIFREYLDDNGDPVTSAGVGDELTVRVRVRSTGRPRTNVAVVDMLPGGFEVLTDSVRDQYSGWYADYRDVREDRVVIYGTFTDRITEIRYRVKLTNPGNFVLPSAFAGSMYDRSIQARTEPGRFEVRAVQ